MKALLVYVLQIHVLKLYACSCLPSRKPSCLRKFEQARAPFITDVNELGASFSKALIETHFVHKCIVHHEVSKHFRFQGDQNAVKMQ
jgi:hypothetical protein